MIQEYKNSLEFHIEDFKENARSSQFIASPTAYFDGCEWELRVILEDNVEVYLSCLSSKRKSRRVPTSFKLSIMKQDESQAVFDTSIVVYGDDFWKFESGFGVNNLITKDSLLNLENGYIKDDAITFQAEINTFQAEFGDPSLDESFWRRFKGIDTDITLIVGDQKIKAHRVILSQKCQYLRSFLYPYNGREILLDDCDFKATLTAIRFIYTRKCIVDPNNLREVLVIGKKFELHELLVSCLELMSPETAALFYLFIDDVAETIGAAERVKRDFSKYVQKNISAILNSNAFWSLPEEDFMSFIDHPSVKSNVTKPTDLLNDSRRKDYSKKTAALRKEALRKEALKKADHKKEEGNKLYKQGLYTDAVKLYTEAISIYPHATYFTNRCQSFMKMEKYSEAVKDAEEAISYDKSHVKAYLKLMRCHILMGNLNEAKCALQTARQTNVTHLVTLAIAVEFETLTTLEKHIDNIDRCWNDKLWTQVIHHMNEVQKISPGMTQYAVKKAQAMVYNKQIIEALNWAGNALRFDLNNVDAVFIRGLVLFYSEEIDKAFTAFKSCVTLDPNHLSSVSYFKKIKLLKAKKEQACQASKKGNVKAALLYNLEALEIEPSNTLVNARLHYVVAVCYQKLDRTLQSLVSCEKAISFDPKYEKAFMKKVDLLMNLKMFDWAAREALLVHTKFKSKKTKKLLDEAQTLRIYVEENMSTDYFAVLGVKGSCSKNELKQAYKEKAKMYHPDRHATASQIEKEYYEEIFKQSKEAYTVLSNRFEF